MNTPLSFPYNGKIGQYTKDFIKKCLIINEERRIGWKELFEHPLVSNNDAGTPTHNIKVDKTGVEILRRIQ
jgi:calcium-dependent protein kinase